MNKVIKTWAKSPIIICFICIVLMVVCFWTAGYLKTDIWQVKVYSVQTQQNISGDEKSRTTSYKYLVGTDKGTFQIEPSGLMASSAFGTLEKDSTYTIVTRGFNVPFLGIYPYIMKVQK